MLQREKMVSGAKFPLKKALLPIQQTILQTLRHQKLGEFATAASGSMVVFSQTARSTDILLKTFDGETTPAVIRFKEALTDQTNALPVSSATGGAS